MTDKIQQTPIPSGIDDQRSRLLRDQMDRQADLDLTPLLVYRLDQDNTERGAGGAAAPYENDLLVNLAWQFHIQGAEGWDTTHTTAQRRTLIRNAIEQHRYRGTPWAVKNALAAGGYKAEVLEHAALDAAWTEADGARWDGRASFDGAVTWAGPEGTRFAMTRHWAEYALELDVGDAVLTRATQASIRAIANATAPARSHLVGLRYTLSTAFDATIRWGNTTTKMVVTSRFHVPHFETWRYPRRVWGGTTAMTWDGKATWGDQKRFDGFLSSESATTFSHGWGRWWRATICHTSGFVSPRTHPDTTHWDGSRWDAHSRTPQPSHWDGTRNWGAVITPAAASMRTIITYHDGRQEAA